MPIVASEFDSQAFVWNSVGTHVAPSDTVRVLHLPLPGEGVSSVANAAGTTGLGSTFILPLLRGTACACLTTSSHC